MTRGRKGGRWSIAGVLWPRVRRADGEEGMALMLVIGTMLVLTITASAMLAYAIGSLPLSRHDQDYNAALGAAQAGIDDYIRHLNQNDSYWLPSSPDCTNPALVGPKGTGCNLSPTPGWVHVNPVATDPKGPEFHYDVDSTTFQTALALTLRSTGRVNGVTRTLEASIGRGGSTDFVYYTNFEDADPSNAVVYPTPPSNQNCVDEYWWGPTGRGSGGGADNGCIEITFITGDKINGPGHSNDTPLMTGTPEFVGIAKKAYSFSTGDPACKTATASNNDWFGCWRDTNSQRPIFTSKPPGYEAPLQLDATTNLDADPGCHFVGQTRIRFTGTGNMLVWSPETTNLNSPSTGTCGGNSPNGVSVPVPTMGVIYAIDNPLVAAHQCAAGEIGDGLPLAGDVTMLTQDQYCGQGNIYIEGTLQGRTTVGADNSIVVTGDLLLAGGIGGSDLLGLVAGNSVQVFHPWIATTVNTGTCAALAWTKTAGQYVTTSPSAQGGATQKSLGWQEGYFSGSGTSMVWNPGRWVTTSTNSQYFRGPTSKPTSLTGSFINAGSPPSGTQVWKSGTWVANSDGTTSWTVGSWQTPPAGQYWQGESWSSTCGTYVTSTTYAEAPGWPHERDLGGVNQIEIYASIQTLQHSFLVQNYDQGTLQGKLSVYGSIAQNYRGIVGRGGGSGTGYLKNYNYDSRLVTQAPPYFPQWANAKWQTARFGEVTPAY
jgi:hypothetical protein